jgi:hypothetical protein
MAVGLIFDGVGVSQAQYEQVRNQVAPDNKAAPGLLYHAAGPTEGGFCVIEVWESEEILGRFFDEQLGQALQEAGINVQPKMFQVVNTMAP